MTPRVDHVTVAGRHLAPLREAFAALGLETEYGGLHSNGVTHMASHGLGDGSYIELISTVEAGALSPVWDAFIRADAGPAAWAVEVAGIAEEAARLREAGIRVEGPSRWHRERPDGVRLEWDLAVPGEASPGSVLPFLIEDRTPRELRVRPVPSAAGPGLAGVAAAVIGVERIEEATRLFRAAYGWDAWAGGRSAFLGARLAVLPEGPVVLAAPEDGAGWLAGRLARFGPAPCAFLLRSGDAAPREGRLARALAASEEWPSGTVRWIEPDRLRGSRIGVLAG